MFVEEITPPDDRFSLVVLSHLRWDGVWQRPQQVISRLSRRARRTWFVEEPRPADVDGPRLRLLPADPVTRVVTELPWTHLDAGGRPWVTFGDERDVDLDLLLADHCTIAEPPVVWLYTPMALPLARRLGPRLLVYDVMDDLTSFRGASEAMRLCHAQALAEADLVFTGGRSLHEGVLGHRHHGTTVCLPSGVDVAHFAAAHPLRTTHDRPVAVYLGVIDERIDLGLIRDLAALLPGWEIRMVGPVTKIDEELLPQAPNITYLGQRPYADLPAILAECDVALMPFAINASTRSLSPTKTPEYLAAGLAVVSTAVPDVVADFGDVVHVAEDARGFAAACERLLAGAPSPVGQRVERILSRRSWDGIAATMAGLIGERLAGGAAVRESA
jgi:glycosyltransferase involved in cell wall biosynthesis